MADTPRVFISYARDDGEPFARALYQAIENENIKAWLDRFDMDTSADWWEQIKVAIEKCEYLVMVATPAALTSDVVRREWTYARQTGTGVLMIQVPTQRTPEKNLFHWMREIELANDSIDWDRLPRWLSSPNYFDLTKEWEMFVNRLKMPSEALRVPFPYNQKPPENFVPRSKEFDALGKNLLSGSHDYPVALTNTVGLIGTGGFGKTTLAQAFIHDERVRLAFDDGILWVTVKQPPNTQQILADLYAELTGEKNLFNTQEKLENALAQRLTELDCLIVIDNVENSADLKPFMCGGEHCAYLITTQQQSVVINKGGIIIPVEEMEMREAIQMIAAGLENQQDSQSAFEELAQRLGEWPVLLELANGALRQAIAWGESLDGALAALNGKLDEEGITALDQEDAKQRNQALALTMQASLKHLNDDQQARLFDLAIFPKSTDIPLTTICQLWDLTQNKTRSLCQSFADRSFFKLDLGRAVIRFHDVLLKYLEEQLGDENTTVAHAHLLDAWGDGWAALPDNYAWDHYAYHLHGAARLDELHALFADQQWMSARFEHDGYTYSGYTTDLMLAWKQVAHIAALSQIEADQDVTSLANCLRYALIRTSINSLAGNYVPAIVAQAVRAGLWTTERALSIARRMPDQKQRAKMYTQLLNTGMLDTQEHGQALQQALAAAQSIKYENSRGEALIALADWLDEFQQKNVFNELREVLCEIVISTKSIQGLEYIVKYFNFLANRLDEIQLEEVLSGIRVATLSIEDELTRACVLFWLAGELDEAQQKQEVLDEWWTVIESVQDPAANVLLDIVFAERLDKSQREFLLCSAFATSHSIQDEKERASMLIALAEKLDETQRESALHEAFTLSQSIQDEEERVSILIALAEQLDEPQREAALHEAFTIAKSIQDQQKRASALVALADKIDEAQREELLSELSMAIQSIEYEIDRATTLSWLASKLNKTQQAEVSILLTAARSIQNDGDRARVLIALADKLDEPQLEGILYEAWTAAYTIEDEEDRAAALNTLATKFDEIPVSEALIDTQRILDEDSRVNTLIALADKLDTTRRKTVLNEASIAIQSITDKWERSDMLIALAGKLGNNQRKEMLSVAVVTATQFIPDESSLVETLIALANVLASNDGALLSKMLAVAQSCEYEYHRAKVIIASIDKLDEERKQEELHKTLAIAKTIPYQEHQAEILIALVDKLDESQREKVLSEALAAAKSIQYEGRRAEILIALADKLAEAQREKVLSEALAAARAIQNEGYRADILTALVDKLEQNQREEALNEALTAAQNIPFGWGRAEKISKLATKLGKAQQEEVLRVELATTQAIQDESVRANILKTLAENIDKKQRLELFLESLQNLQHESRSAVLSFCQQGAWFPSEYVSPDTVFQVTRHIQEICTEWRWM